MIKCERCGKEKEACPPGVHDDNSDIKEAEEDED